MADSRDLEQRIAHLETVVIELQNALAQLTLERPSTTEHLEPPEFRGRSIPVDQDEIIFVPEERSPDPVTPVAITSTVSGVKQEELWLNRLGIGLLLLGVAFLFKYSIDQGWIVPVVRLGFGLALGSLLLSLGWRLERRRLALSQILMGGSIGTFYLTGFAAYQLYHLIVYPIAFIWMVAVTLLAFFLSLRSQQPVLSVVGTMGGLGTPFVLYSGQGSPVSLVAYTCIILMGTSAIYLRQHWQSLLLTSYIGTNLTFGWAVLSFTSMQLTRTNGELTAVTYLDLVGMQIGFGLGWIAFAVIPLVGALLQLKRWRQARTPMKLGILKTPTLHVLAFLTPILFILATGTIWQLKSRPFGWLIVVAALLYGIGGGVLRQRKRLKALGSTHWLAAAVLLSFALLALVSGYALLILLALEAFCVHFVARRTTVAMRVMAHLLSGIVSFWSLVQFYDSVSKIAVLNTQALTQLGVMGLLLGASFMIRARPVARFYQFVLHFWLLAWLWRELSLQGVGYVTVAWGLYAMVLLVIGLRQDWLSLRWAGMATLVLAVLKLLSYDLTNVNALWRIFLFLGFGAVFLGLSYALQDLWRPKSVPPTAPDRLEQDE